MPQQDRVKTITIIGGGLSGLTVFYEQVKAYQSAPQDAPDLHINWIEKSGNFGAGIAYNADDDVFLLNQPAKLMSPFADDPQHFTRWLEKNDPGSDEDSFVPRRLYRRYLDELLNDALETAKQSGGKLKTSLISAAADDLTPQQNGSYRITLKSGLTLGSDAVILATGHLLNRDWQHLQGVPHYQQSPFHKADIAREVNTATGNIGIIGTGQSMMDCLAALEAIGTKEKIYLFSRDNILPWEFDPKKFGDDTPRYELQYLTPENISADSDFNSLKNNFAKEIKHAEAGGFTLGHVLTGFDKQGFLKAAAHHPKGDDIRKFTGLIDKYYANPTTPERFRLFKKLQNSGQVEIIRQEINTATLRQDADGGFTIGGKVKIAHLFNSAALGRSAFDKNGLPVDKLARAADSAGALAWHPKDKASIRPGRQNRAGLYVTGPQTNATRWGVETFREHSRDAAREALSYVLTLPATTNNQSNGQENRKENNHVKDRKISAGTHGI